MQNVCTVRLQGCEHVVLVNGVFLLIPHTVSHGSNAYQSQDDKLKEKPQMPNVCILTLCMNVCISCTRSVQPASCHSAYATY